MLLCTMAKQRNLGLATAAILLFGVLFFQAFARTDDLQGIFTLSNNYFILGFPNFACIYHREFLIWWLKDVGLLLDLGSFRSELYWDQKILFDCSIFIFAVQALRDLYRALNSPTELKNWKLEGGDPCEESWTGVSCYQSSVIEMYFTENN